MIHDESPDTTSQDNPSGFPAFVGPHGFPSPGLRGLALLWVLPGRVSNPAWPEPIRGELGGIMPRAFSCTHYDLLEQARSNRPAGPGTLTAHPELARPFRLSQSIHGSGRARRPLSGIEAPMQRRNDS